MFQFLIVILVMGNNYFILHFNRSVAICIIEIMIIQNWVLRRVIMQFVDLLVPLLPFL